MKSAFHRVQLARNTSALEALRVVSVLIEKEIQRAYADPRCGQT